MGELPADREAETRVAVAATRPAVGLVEGVEDVVLCLGRDADAFVRHLEAQDDLVVDVSGQFDTHVDRALLGEPDDIHEGLAQPRRILHLA